jgi:hypothetical protein
MAADLIEDPTICQSFIHDIESAFFTLLWMAILYLKSSWEMKLLSSFISSIFHPPVFGSSGGSSKLIFMRSEQLDTLEFATNKPLTALLRGWHEALAIRHAKRPELPHPQTFSYFNDVILRTLPGDSQGAESASKPTAAVESSQEESYESQLRRYEVRMSALKNHDAVLDMLDLLLQNPEWPAEEPAERQRVILSCVEKRGLRSSSKRCREAAAASEGDTLTVIESLPKRNRSL